MLDHFSTLSMKVLIFLKKTLRTKSRDVFRTPPNISNPGRHLFVQSQQWKHQDNM